jgi:hypothetical protein
MSTTPEEPEESPATGDAGPETAEPVGVEVGFVEGEGTTFEPEEDPEGGGDGSDVLRHQPVPGVRCRETT